MFYLSQVTQKVDRHLNEKVMVTFTGNGFAALVEAEKRILGETDQINKQSGTQLGRFCYKSNLDVK